MSAATSTSEMVAEPKTRRAKGRFWRRLAWLVLALGLAPFVLTLAYAVIPPLSMPMIGRAVMLQPVDRRWTPLDKIAPSVPLAVLSSEDARFCQHWGVDFDAISLVMRQGGKNGPSRGASTVAMQVAKNLYLWPLPTAMRKPLEIPLALWIDLVWSKQRVIEVYLNIAQWGDGIYGIEAAAQHYYNKPAAALSPREAALLAVALPNPIRRDAGAPTRRLRNLAGLIAGRAQSAPETLTCLK